MCKIYLILYMCSGWCNNWVECVLLSSLIKVSCVSHNGVWQSGDTTPFILNFCTRPFHTSITTGQSTWCDNQAEIKLQQHRCEKLKYRVKCLFSSYVDYMFRRQFAIGRAVSEHQNVHNCQTTLLGQGDTVPLHWWDWPSSRKDRWDTRYKMFEEPLI